jgi:hypothetical protein
MSGQANNSRQAPALMMAPNAFIKLAVAVDLFEKGIDLLTESQSGLVQSLFQGQPVA